MNSLKPAFQLLTRWHFAASREAVWRELIAPEQWPQWWRGVERVETLEPGDAHGVGAVRRITWKSRLPYRIVVVLRVRRIDRPNCIEAAADGELRGLGRWTLSGQGDETQVEYLWQVDPEKPWMRALLPLLKPLFRWNHDIVMAWGEEGLKQRLAQRAREQSVGAA